MSTDERDKLIRFIMENDSNYSYSNVNFKFYTTTELRYLKKRIERERERNQRNDDGIQPNFAM